MLHLFSQHALRVSGSRLRLRRILSLQDLQLKMSHEEKLKNYRTAPFDARFPNTNQTRNCYQNYLDYHRCNKALTAKNKDPAPCEWYHRVYKSLCPIAWVQKWDDQLEAGTFAGKI